MDNILKKANDSLLKSENIVQIIEQELENKRLLALADVKQKHPEYRIEKQRKRIIHTIFGTIKTTITYLSKSDLKTKKRITFAFYHDNFLAKKELNSMIST